MRFMRPSNSAMIRNRGKPVVVAWRGNRSVVCAASYEARKFGVRSAMPAVRAERLCPNAVFLPPDFPRYRAVSRQVREIFKRHTDLIEPLSLDEAYLDVSDNKTGLPTATQVARTIREQIRSELSLTASAGVAPNKFLAKIASVWRKPDGLFVIQPQQVDSFLLPLPVSRLPGVGKVTEERLQSFQVQTVADLRALDLSTSAFRKSSFDHRARRLHPFRARPSLISSLHRIASTPLWPLLRQLFWNFHPPKFSKFCDKHLRVWREGPPVVCLIKPFMGGVPKPTAASCAQTSRETIAPIVAPSTVALH
jgi:nucleotidyltransferase/DNA polymerase involved in DNA repair